MIYVCPHCGFSIPSGLHDGVSFCSGCNRIFDSSIYNQLVSAAWQIKKENITLEKLKWCLKDDDLAIFVSAFVLENGFTHEQFVALLKKLGITNKLVE